jgi:hypothetical protein
MSLLSHFSKCIQRTQEIKSAGNALVKQLIDLFYSTKIEYQTGLPQIDITALKQEQDNAK